MKRSTVCFLVIAACAAIWASVERFSDTAKELHKEGDYPETVSRFEAAMAETNLVVADAVMERSRSRHNNNIVRARIKHARLQLSSRDEFGGIPVAYSAEEFTDEEGYRWFLNTVATPLHVVTRTQVYGTATAWAALYLVGTFAACLAALLLSKFLLLNGARLGAAGVRNGWHFFLARIGEVSRAIRNNDTNKT